MKVLENSPVDALALNYLSFGFLSILNNFWTWLAFSFWNLRIRSTQPELLPPGPSTSDSPDPVPEVSDHDDVLILINPSIAAASDGAVDVDGVTKGKFKFTLCYDTTECDCVLTEATGEEWEEEEEEEEWWNRLLRMRRGEFEKGWYTCQDLTVLNGNVVRFWDGATTTTTSNFVRAW